MKIHNPNITGSLVLSGSAGTSVNFTSADKGVSGSFSGSFEGSLKNVKTIDATTESTIESSIDTLANLTSIQGNTVTLGGNLVTQNNNVTINAAGAARTLTLNESLTVGDGHDGTLTYSAASKTLTVEDTTNLNQDLTSDASPTFAAGTITGDLSVGGTLTAQEVHTEFESASILFTSGSTRFGNDTTDTHRVTGSMDISGSLQLPHGDVTIIDNLSVDGTSNLDNTDIDGTLTVDGGNIVFNEDSADQDFRVESNGNTHMLFVDGGNNRVGVGTSTPAKLFHVEGSTGGDFLARIKNTEGSNGEGLGILTNNTAATSRLLHIENSNGRVFTIFNDAKVMIGDGSQQNFSASSASLHIAQNEPSIRLQDMNHAPGTFCLINANSGGGGLEIIADGNNKNAGSNIDFQVDGSSKMVISGSGEVGIGTNNPKAVLQVRVGSNQNLGFNSLSSVFRLSAFNDAVSANVPLIINASDLRFHNSDSEKMRITSGNVGIGTDSPDATLDLRGTQKIQTNTVPASIIVGTNDTTDHTGQDTALCIDFRNLSTTNGVAGGIVGLDKDGLELSKILLVTDNHDANTSSIRMFTSTNANQRKQMVNINNDGMTVGGSASAQRALHVQSSTGICLSDGDRDRVGLRPISPDANTGHFAVNVRSGGSSIERMRLTSTGNLCVGPSGSSAGFTPALTVTGTNPCLGLRLQDGNSGTFYNTVLSSNGTSIKKFYSHTISFATAANDGGTSESTKMSLDTSGNLAIAGSYTSSDINLKTNIEELPNVLNVLSDIKPIKYKYKRDIKEGIDTVNIGLIAQEVEKHFPELILENSIHDTEEQKFKSLNYNGMIPILLKSIQELSSKVNELQQKIEELEK